MNCQNCNHRAHILHLEAKLLVSLIQMDAYTRVNYMCERDTCKSIVMRLVLQPPNPYSGAWGNLDKPSTSRFRIALICSLQMLANLL
mmetsp:Transcript_81451/g.119335  ORF Transcript_81451/g.119335 Transcript_81451/m.119335 type:complete len:87 (+) Transcript_81451:552-812(+)